ncbi:bifunctional phosphatase PAP2/diacylglycerol kinase family protein [Streptomyces sp. MUM 178J]|uniref:bifunctional phosphatase PAP2/diacylglycerol kinase family protein n=1 Tax=Streptomyces sp. MUM 178J TaxID=2791991 RepID=UPI001F044746|nr:bifunctional phosphatase PAP2/diacylglycerol kinase family protein [Streptomyces sp. MUM 178J]WRQ83375.1 phosphatase PAP2 family protein [Streptomyces sp. MUM 178J]
MPAVLGGWDRRLLHAVADREWPGAERALPLLSRSANHGLLWFGTAAAMALLDRRPRTRRAAARGVVSLALASAAVNTVGKRSVGRARPVLDAIPVIRRLKRQPFTTSFPSGHSASAAAFATGVALESRGWGAAVAPVAVAVAASRVYTGAHYPGDVLAGAALGVGAAWAVRGVTGPGPHPSAAAPPAADAPALPGGAGLVVVVNEGAGSAGSAATVREALPHAEYVRCAPGALRRELEGAAARCRALGILGGDGTVGVAAAVAVAYGVPLAVFPGGTLNHFAQDLGVESPLDVCRAVERGTAVRVDLGRFAPGPGGAAEPGWFVNTLSLGVYPELVRLRERWSHRIGGWPAGVLAAAAVLRGEHPLRARVQGRDRAMWLLFAGNCAYGRSGPSPGRRSDLADGLLDVRVVHGGRLPGLRLLAAALAGPLGRSPVHAARRLSTLRISGIGPGTPLAYDGELTEAPRELTVDKVVQALTVYRPLPAAEVST